MRLPNNIIFDLTQQIGHKKNQIISKKITHQDDVHLSLFSFDAGEKISAHSSNGDAMVQVLEGTAFIDIDGEAYGHLVA